MRAGHGLSLDRGQSGSGYGRKKWCQIVVAAIGISEDHEDIAVRFDLVDEVSGKARFADARFTRNNRNAATASTRPFPECAERLQV
jgi:hypothetical protein